MQHGLSNEQLHKLQGGRCYLCNGRFGARGARLPTRDHVVPKARGGRSFANILLAHAGCNTGKGNKSPTACQKLYLEIINIRAALEPQPEPRVPNQPKGTKPNPPGTKQARKQAAFLAAMELARQQRLAREAAKAHIQGATEPPPCP